MERITHIHEAFEKIATKFPRRIAVVQGERSLTYQTIVSAYYECVSYLEKEGVFHNSIVGVLLPSSTELVISILSIFKTGGVHLPLSPAFSEKRMKQVFDQCRPGFIITDQSSAGWLRSFLPSTDLAQCKIITVDGSGRYSSDLYTSSDVTSNNVNTVVDGDDNAYIVYTSGSTGEAKGVLGTHSGLGHFITWEITEFRLDETIIVSQFTQPTFDASFRDFFVPLCTGGTLVIPSQSISNNISLLVEWVRDRQIKLIHCVPSFLRAVVKELKAGNWSAGFPDLEFLLLAGEPLYSSDISEARKFFGTCEFVNLYGASETTLIKTFHRIGNLDETVRAIPVGKPISNTAVAIINDGHICRPGEIGEVYIKTPYWTKGYLGRKDLTDKCFVQNPIVKDRVDIVYKTGDLGRQLQGGDIEILGRLDNQVKVNGVRVELNEVTEEILRLGGVDEAYIVAQKDAENNVSLVCYYTGSADLSVDATREHLRKQLNESHLPSYYFRLKQFPLTLNGKIDKKALPLPDQLRTTGNIVPPEAGLESELAEIWSEILGITVGRNVSFFQLGGNSLKAIQLISRIYKKFNKLVTIADVFSMTTIQAMASHLNSLEKRKYVAIKPLPHQSSYNLSYSQQRVWIVDQFQEERDSYVICESFSIEGPVNQVFLREAFRKAIIRHESLRTVFIEADGQPMQKILNYDDTGFALKIVDLSGQHREWQDVVEEERTTGFDLQRGPLIRSTLISLSPERSVLIISIHHIVADGWSVAILVNELADSYHELVEGKDAEWPALTIQFKDYASWYSDQINQGHAKLAAFWRNELGPITTSVDLRYDIQRGEQKTNEADALYLDLHPDVTAKLRSVAENTNTSLFTISLEVLQLLIFKLSRQRQFVIGTPVSLRVNSDLENQVGNYLNVLPLRTDVVEHDTFVTALKNCRDRVLAAFDHQLYPFDLILSDLSVSRVPNRNQLFDIGFTYHNYNNIIRKSAGQGDSRHHLKISNLPLTKHTVKTDLWFFANEHDSTIQLCIVYNASLFRKKTAQRMLDAYVFLLREALQSPAIVVSELIRACERYEAEHVRDRKFDTLLK
jgi:amino acid adenylation domain-containing protein